MASSSSVATAAQARSTSRSSVKTVPFSGRYQGGASLLINNGVVTIPSVSGKGTGTLVGASTVTGKGSSSSTASATRSPVPGASSEPPPRSP